MEKNKQKLKLVQKTVLSLIAIFLLTFGVAEFIGVEVYDTAEATLKSQVKSKSLKDLEDTIDGAGKTFVDFAREVAIAAAIVIIIMMAYSLLVKKSAEGLADMKGRAVGLVIAILFIFFTETLLGALFGLFGYTL